MSEKVDKDLLGLLQNQRLTDVRLKAWEYVLGLTSTEEGFSHLLNVPEYLNCFLEHLTLTVGDADSCKLAHKCLVNISSQKEGVLKLMEIKVDLAASLIGDICDSNSEFVEEKCYILSNLTTYYDFVKIEHFETILSEKLKSIMSCFFSTNPNIREKYKFVAVILSNLSKHAVFRKLFIEEKNLLSDVIVCLNSNESSIRRLGTALILRNICSDTDYHSILLQDLNIVPSLLLPLMGPEEYEEDEMEQLPLDCQYLENNKEREKLPQIRKSLVHALSLLCYTEEGWNYLKSKGVYYAVREFHKWEQDENTCEAIETLVGYLLVENYTALDKTDPLPIPSETDILNDIPDIIV